MKNTFTVKDIKERIALLEEQTQIMEATLRDKAQETYN